MRFLIVCALIVCSISLAVPEADLGQSRSQKTSRQNQYAANEVQILKAIAQANITAPLAPNALTSYRISVCIFISMIKPPVGVSDPSQSHCLKGQTGVLAPSSTYLRVSAGATRLFHVVNENEAWQFAVPARPGGETAHLSPSKLEAMKLRAMKENVSHSLLALYQVLNREGWTSANLKIIRLRSEFLVRWIDSGSVNEFYFDRQDLLCRKQVRINQDGAMNLKYSNYKSVDGVMLPHTIETGEKTGKITGTQSVEQWVLAVSWPDNFFTPQGVVKSF